MNIISIIGARPQIIKAAAISRAVRSIGQIDEKILHTGQHYDDNMSEVFFRELGIPAPDYNLHVGSGSHAEQTGEMMKGIEKVLQGEPIGDSRLEIGDFKPFDGVIIYGDTNSTLAGALAASKLQVPVFHVEAGLRSFNMSMPEEINRIVADRLGNLLFAPTETAVHNLEREGLADNAVLSGDVMFDNAMYISPMADTKSDIIERLGLSYRNFVLATIHRPANTDNKANLESIFRALTDIAATGIDVVVPLHPRTWKQLRVERLELSKSPYLHLIEPVSFFDIIRLEKNARVVMTDSGGVQKEAFFYGTPCVILRPETEWVEIVDAGAGILADADYERIMQAYADLSGREVSFPQLFGDAHASEHILEEIIHYLN